MSEHMPTEDRLRELLVGKSIVKAEMRDEAPPEGWADGPTGYLTLSDGAELQVWGNTGGCICSAGDYPLSTLATCDNLITNVEVEESPGGDDGPYDGHYRIFVLAGDERINVASFDGSDGNGYYGTGWWLNVADRAS